ncbi:MAG TPA: hypothetical protein VMV69_11915 [Pirellulales bacterium]|nr:hypothetical protein [Pirellulales bacterium]
MSTKRPAAVLVKATRPQYVVCIKNDDYPVSLEKRKIYQVLPDADAQDHDLLRVIDESGEDYLYPIGYFLSVRLSAEVVNAVATGITAMLCMVQH